MFHNTTRETNKQTNKQTLTEHDFQDVFKNGRSAENGAYGQKGTTTRVLVASRPEVSF
jgi:hypothetical protein